MKKSILSITAALILSIACLTGCGQTAAVNSGTELASSGILVLSVNPEIAVEYDENGIVTGVTARNDDALAIINSCEGLIGQQTRTAVTALVTAIGQAGYFVEEIEGERRQLTLEIEAGSKLPHDAFLDEVIADIRNCINTNSWIVPMEVENESDYGLTDFADTDYGPNNDGVTDYNDTDYGPNNDGVTDYDDTDYGPNNDGVTDYDDGNSDYKAPAVTTPPVNSSNTDYDSSSDYNDSQSDYNNGQSDYDDGYSNYDDGQSDYDDAYSDYDDGQSDYDDGQSDYDDGQSDYDDSDYGDSDYDD